MVALYGTATEFHLLLCDHTVLPATRHK